MGNWSLDTVLGLSSDSSQEASDFLRQLTIVSLTKKQLCYICEWIQHSFCLGYTDWVSDRCETMPGLLGLITDSLRPQWPIFVLVNLWWIRDGSGTKLKRSRIKSPRMPQTTYNVGVPPHD